MSLVIVFDTRTLVVSHSNHPTVLCIYVIFVQYVVSNRAFFFFFFLRGSVRWSKKIKTTPETGVCASLWILLIFYFTDK